MKLNFEALLDDLAKTSSPDLILVTGEPPFTREPSGKVVPLTNVGEISAEDIEGILVDVAGKEAVQLLHERKEYECAIERPKLGRFRVTFYEEIKGPALAVRRIPFHIPTPDEIGLPKNIQELALRHDGLILVTGPNGHGKSTTLASLVDYINANREAHIVTIEDPVEFTFKRKKSVISQRAVGINTLSFPIAVRHTLRQNVDVIVLGEMRDLETISTALTLAETGHLVLATLHTHDAARSIERIVDVFPAGQQEQIAIQLSHSLTAIISQRLIMRADEKGRVCAREIMLATDGVRHAIRTRKVSELYSQIQVGRALGMINFDESVLNLVRFGDIDPKQAIRNANDPRQMKVVLRELGYSIPE